MAPYMGGIGMSMSIGYSVDDDLEGCAFIDERLPLLQNADLNNKIVLLRVDHNVVKKGKILDQYRIDVTLPTLYNIIQRGGRPILMTHIGRPYDKKTKTIHVKNDDSVDAVVSYLQRKLRVRFVVPKFCVSEESGIENIDTSINWLIADLKVGKIGGIYLPNTRWFAGEESKNEMLDRFVVQLAGLADVYVNDAFGSWQPHASTFHITKYLPSYAGLCMQDELSHVRAILEPTRPFLAMVAGSKYDTKIGPLNQLYKKVDKLVLGGVIYNTYLCAKYGVKIAGVQESDIELAKELVELDKKNQKIVELNMLVETDTLDGRFEGQYRTIDIKDFKEGKTYNYIVDVDALSFKEESVLEAISSSKTIFVNAVMGFMPNFSDGTSAMIQVIDSNHSSHKFIGGGDTLEAFKSLQATLYQKALNNCYYYMFTGGGTVLKVIEEGDPMELPTVKALIQSKKDSIVKYTMIK